MRKNVTIADVAREAGVSKGAASAVLNGARTSSRVSATTRERVLETARALRYSPNAAAQSLVRRSTHTFGVAFNRSEFTFFANPYVVAVLDGILEAATEADFNVLLFNKPWHDAAQSSPAFGNSLADGFIILAPLLDSDMVPELTAMGVPLVVVGAPAEKWEVPAVTVDNMQGGSLAAHHLLALGHREIGFVTAGEDEAQVSDALERRQGFLATLQEVGISLPPEYIVPGYFNRWGGYQAAQHLLTMSQRPTAIFAANDHSAIGVIAAAKDLGIRVPEELSVIGFDDTAEATTTIPALTTIRNPMIAIGRQASTLLIAQIKGESPETTTHFHVPELVIRASTAPLAP